MSRKHSFIVIKEYDIANIRAYRKVTITINFKRR